MLLIALLLGSAAAFWSWLRPTPGPDQNTVVASEPVDGSAPESPAAQASSGDASGELAQALPSLPQAGDLAARAAREYRARARHPPWSRPLVDGVDPLRRDRAVTPGRSLPRSLWPVLEVAVDQVSHLDSEPVALRVSLDSGEGMADPRGLEGSVYDERGAPVRDLAFERDRDAPVFRATLDGLEPGAYRVVVRASTDAGEEREATTGFLVSAPGAAFTGRYRDAIVDGNLRIEAELEVTRPSRFHLEGTLAAGDGAPIAWAQAARHLEPGRRWLALDFHGLALRESGHEGPYTLASVALTTVDGVPNQKSPLEIDAHRTGPYRLGDFNDAPYDDPRLLRAAEQLEKR